MKDKSKSTKNNDLEKSPRYFGLAGFIVLLISFLACIVALTIKFIIWLFSDV